MKIEEIVAEASTEFSKMADGNQGENEDHHKPENDVEYDWVVL